MFVFPTHFQQQQLLFCCENKMLRLLFKELICDNIGFCTRPSCVANYLLVISPKTNQNSKCKYLERLEFNDFCFICFLASSWC